MLKFSTFAELSNRNLEECGYAPGYTRADFKSEIEKTGAINKRFSVWTRSDGAPIRIIESATAVRNDGGKTLYYDGLVERISERDIENVFKTIINALADHVYLIDAEGAVLETNTAACALRGVGYDELIGRNILEGLPEKIARNRWEQIVKCIEGKTVVSFEDSRDGTFFENHLYPIFDEDGAVARIVIYARDVTTEKGLSGEKDRLIGELTAAIAQIKTLKGIIPVCSNCRKIRDARGLWWHFETYLTEHADAEISHGLCPECSAKLYPDLFGDGNR